VYLLHDPKVHDKQCNQSPVERSLQNFWVVQKFQRRGALARSIIRVVGILDTGGTSRRQLICMQFIDG